MKASLADGAAAGRGGKARHRQPFAAPAAPGVWRETCGARTGLAILPHAIRRRNQSAAGSSPSGGGLRRRAGVRRQFMPRWLQVLAGATACWTIAIWRVRPRRRNRPAGRLLTAGFRRRKVVPMQMQPTAPANPHPSGAPRRPPQRALQNISAETPGIRLRALSWGCRTGQSSGWISRSLPGAGAVTLARPFASGRATV